ncbi:MAG: ATP-binding protein [Deferribacterales bacterium]
MSNQLYFKVNTELKSIIGKDLINDDNVAIIELIKNSYDAQASLTTVEFNSMDDKLIIADNGIGMSLEDISEKWLNIAHSSKKVVKDKAIAGNKGVGRFSCDRLGTILEMYTFTKNSLPIKLTVNWEDFEIYDPQKEITHISMKYEEVSANEVFNQTSLKLTTQGTVLVIKNLRKKWGNESLIKLRRELGKFISPYANTDFLIEMVCIGEEFSSNLNGAIRNTIISDTISKTSYIKSKIENNIITSSLFYEGQQLFTIYENNPYQNLDNIEMEIVYLGTYEKAFFTRRMGYRNSEYGSIFLFVNGFRISPLGDPDNDWLGVDRRHAQGTRRYLGNRDILGRIDIKDNNNLWKVTSSREGIVENDSYNELTFTNIGETRGRLGYFQRIFRKLERYVIEGLDWDGYEDENAFNILLKTGNDNNLEKRTPDNNRRKQIVQSLLSIITAGGTKSSDILFLEFNDGFLTVLKEQHDNIINTFYNEMEGIIEKSDKPEQFHRNLEHFKQLVEKAKEKDRKNQLLLQQKYELEKKLEQEKEKSRLLEIERIKAEEEKTKANEARIIADKARIEAEKDKKTAEIKVQQKAQENLFLKATLSTDMEDVVKIAHIFIIWSNTIKKTISRLISELSISNPEILEKHTRVYYALELIDKINANSKIISKHNVKINSQNTTTDLIGFIKNYLNDALISIEDQRLEYNIKISDDIEFITTFKTLEFSIVLDNLLNNAKKAGATMITIDIQELTKDYIILAFSDNGKGLSETINDPNDIFNFGFTTTDGSGVGLYHCKSIIDELKGEISVSKYNGFTLYIKIPKLV